MMPGLRSFCGCVTSRDSIGLLELPGTLPETIASRDL